MWICCLKAYRLQQILTAICGYSASDGCLVYGEQFRGDPEISTYSYQAAVDIVRS
jgi:hypothetical protein